MYSTHLNGQCRLLIIDDDPETNELYSSFLEANGYIVKVAVNGDQALEINAGFNAHLALIDLVLADESGLDVLDKLLAQNQEIRCLILTAYADIQSALQALRHGAVDYISKTISLDELLEALIRAAEKIKFQQEKKAFETEIEQQNHELTKTNERLRLEIIERTRAETAVLKMIDEVEAARNKLKKANIELEEKVKDRTLELTKNHAQLEAIIESTANGILVVDESGNILHTNKRFQTLWNIPGEMVTAGNANTVYDYVLGQLSKPNNFSSAIKLLYKNSNVSQDLLETIDGRIIERFNHPLTSEESQKGQVWSFRDITEQKRAEAALAESENKYRGILETSSEGCWIIDAQTKETLEVNKSLCKLIGYTREEILGKTPLDFVDDENRKILIDQTSKIMSTDHRIYDISLMRKDGSMVPCLFNASTIYSKGKAKYAVAFITDITEHVTLEQTLLAAKQEAERANNAKSEFLSRMSHELRTPLNAIIGFGQLLTMDSADFTEAHKNGIAHIYNSGKHLLLLINEILDISKVDAGEMAITLEYIPIITYIDESLTMLHSLSESNNINIIKPTATDDHIVIADKLRLKQVLLNLLSNAIKYNCEGGSLTIEITTSSSTDMESDNKMFRIMITDTGPGIKPEDFEKVFLPFSRLSSHTNIEGTGVGLTITKMLVELMGGHIGFTSEYGKGSTFWFELPSADHITHENSGKVAHTP